MRRTKKEKLDILNMLAKEYPSDKIGHGYFPVYAEYLPDDCRLMLEVGVAKGLSAKIWSEFYGGENLDLHILDLFLDKDHVSTKWVRNQGFVPFQGDQSDLKFLSTIPHEYEVISEDGSHNSHHQLITFKHLFLNNLQSGGVYFLEDTHCCKQSSYWGGEVKSFEDTVLWMFKNYLETSELVNPYFNEGEQDVFKSLIKEVKICADEKLIVIIRN